MAYIGKSIESGTFSVLDTSGNTYNGSNTTFSLGTQVGSTAQLLVSHDGVIQKPGTDYTLASGGTQITFTTAPASGASIFIVEISGAVGGPLDADLNGTELILDTDGDTSITADTDDQIDIKVAGADDFQIVANNFKVLSGSTLTIESGGTITNSGTASGFGVALDDVTTGDAASTLATSAGNITIDAQGNDTDIIFKGTDGGADITALTLDMSADGHATFKNGLTLSDGDVTLASGHGISFAATGDGSGSMANELLDDYEEGTWTPTFRNYGGTDQSVSGEYTKIGELVVAGGTIGTDGTSDSSSAAIAGLPYTISNDPANNGHGGVLINFTNSSSSLRAQTVNNTNYVEFTDASGNTVNYNDFGANKVIRFTIIYKA